VQQHHAVLDLAVETLQFFREPPHFFRVHDGLRHIFARMLLLRARCLIPACKSTRVFSFLQTGAAVRRFFFGSAAADGFR
jgi:hypothetical protein